MTVVNVLINYFPCQEIFSLFYLIIPAKKMEKDFTRREVIRSTLTAGVVFFIEPTALWADTHSRFRNFSLQERLDAIYLGKTPRSGGIKLKIPPVVEDGSLVPIKIHTNISMPDGGSAKNIHLLVDHNPDPLIFSMTINPLIESAYFESKIRMAKPSNVRLIVESDKNNFWEHKIFVKATGGCG